MGICSVAGAHNKAPEYFCNSMGVPSWSGVAEIDFNDKIKADLKKFVYFEAKRRGWNDANNDCVNYGNESMFHPEFFGGEINRLWIENYQIGVAEYEQHKTKKPSF